MVVASVFGDKIEEGVAFGCRYLCDVFSHNYLLILVLGPAAITVASQDARHAFNGVLGVATADAIFFVLSATG